jgi:putative N6-adenine-specific DNA methylase
MARHSQNCFPILFLAPPSITRIIHPMDNPQYSFQMIAKTSFGLEDLLASELEAIGAKKVHPGNRSVSFSGDNSILYKANLRLRTALRILKPIRKFRADNENDLYDEVQRINWSRYMDINDTLAVDSTVHSSYFTHSHFVALKVKDAIVDQFRKKSGKRPSVNLDNPTLRVHLHMAEKSCSISLDSSGSSLHLRGYRKEANEAPLNEVLAAGMILLSGWDKSSQFLDPMCGSGTLPIEAALIAGNIAPGKFRKQFGFMNWRDFERDTWEMIRQEAESEEQPISCKITGSDISPEAIRISRQNLDRAALGGKIQLKEGDFFQLPPPEGSGLILMNPPYGERLQPEDDDINGFYRQIGDQLKQAYQGWDAWILSANKEAFKYLGLQTSKKRTLFNGPLECKFHKYSLYAGSRKAKRMQEENTD